MYVEVLGNILVTWQSETSYESAIIADFIRTFSAATVFVIFVMKKDFGDDFEAISLIFGNFCAGISLTS